MIVLTARNDADGMGSPSVRSYQRAASHVFRASSCPDVAGLLVELRHSGYTRVDSAPASMNS